MALTNQPYFPFYVDDYLSDEKLAQVSPSSEGIFIRIMCIMHKSNDYGIIKINKIDEAKLKQNVSKIEAKLKQNVSKIDLIEYLEIPLNKFCLICAKLQGIIRREIDVIIDSLIDLLAFEILTFKNDSLMQKRMVEDGKKSMLRAKSGSKGGKSSTKINTIKTPKNASKRKQNPENENENEIVNEVESVNESKNGNEKKLIKGESKKFKKPNIDEIYSYLSLLDYSGDKESTSKAFFNYYESNGWKVGRGNPMKDWKAALRGWISREKDFKPKKSQAATDKARRQEFFKKHGVKQYL